MTNSKSTKYLLLFFPKSVRFNDVTQWKPDTVFHCVKSVSDLFSRHSLFLIGLHVSSAKKNDLTNLCAHKQPSHFGQASDHVRGLIIALSLMRGRVWITFKFQKEKGVHCISTSSCTSAPRYTHKNRLAALSQGNYLTVWLLFTPQPDWHTNVASRSPEDCSINS